MSKPIYIRAKIQQSLALGHIADDGGAFAWVMCRKGLQEAAGQKFKSGDTPPLKVTVEYVDEEARELSKRAAGEPCTEPSP